MDKQIKPIRPEEVVSRKQEIIPLEVIEVFNDLIAQKFQNGSALVFQKDVLKKLEDSGLKRNEIFAKNWLDVEGIYRENGWKVEYDKPGYNESYEASFRFVAIKSIK